MLGVRVESVSVGPHKLNPVCTLYNSNIRTLLGPTSEGGADRSLVGIIVVYLRGYLLPRT